MTYAEQYKQEQKKLVDEYKALFLRQYPLVEEVTTPTQLKNGTTMFEVTANDGKVSRFACYTSGMVRKIIRTRFGELSCYQLNPQRKSTNYYAHLDENGKVKVSEYPGVKRVLITDELTRLVFLKEYLIKNEGLTLGPTWENVIKLSEDYMIIDGVTYKKV